MIDTRSMSCITLVAFAALAFACGSDSSAPGDDAGINGGPDSGTSGGSDAASQDGGGPNDGGMKDGDPGPIGEQILSYLGGSKTFIVDDQARDVAVDASGNIFITGGLYNFDGTLFTGGPDRRMSGGPTRAGEDIFVVKLAPDGKVLYATLIGGPAYDRPYAIEVDAQGRAYVAGRAGANFPTTAGVLQPTFAGDDMPNGAYGTQDGFVLRLAADGSLDWATYVGDPGPAFIRDLAIDPAGNSYLGVTLVRNNFPHATAGSFRAAGSANQHAALVKLSPDGKQVVWGGHFATDASTNLSGGVPSVRVGPGGDVFFAYGSDDDNDPVTTGAVQTARAGAGDLVVARVKADGSALVYATYLGGTGDEAGETHYLEVDAQGRAIVMCNSTSSALPVGSPPGALKATNNNGGTHDVLVARISADGKSIVAATFVGGSGEDHAEGIAIDPTTGRIVVTGGTSSADFPTTSKPFATGAASDGTVFALDPSLGASSLVYSIRVGGAGNDESFRGVAVDHTGAILAVGHTNSSGLATEHAVQPTYGGGPHDAWWMRLRQYP